MLRVLSMARMHAGGKKPGMRDSLKRSMSGKDAKQAMLNAEHLLSMDPRKADYAEGLLKNANKAGYSETIKWIGPILFDLLKGEKKPNANKLKSLKDAMEEAGGRAEKQGDAATATECYELAVKAIDTVVRLNPNDGPASNDLRDLAGKLTIVRGKYSETEDFRDSLADAEHAKILHDSDRVVQSEDAVANLIAAARRAWEEDPLPARLNTLVEHLTRRELKTDEQEAIRLLMAEYKKTQNYNQKMRADEIRIKQLKRQARELKNLARKSGSDEDKQQLRLAIMELADTEIQAQRERCEQYPTDMRQRYKLGAALFAAKRWDDAIPIFQEAQNDPKHRVQSKYLMGRSFFEREIYEQAAQVLVEASDEYEVEGDDLSKEMLYWTGRALEAAGDATGAVSAYGKLLRKDYNYMDGDVRNRLDELKKQAQA
jgi:Flp pilus assembly protein TadD